MQSTQETRAWIKRSKDKKKVVVREIPWKGKLPVYLGGWRCGEGREAELVGRSFGPVD